ncbi:MAG: cysteine desulfurase family protein, partial [Candidatus Muiribacteriota bacterium]
NIKDNTVLISVMHANNEIGTVQPVREIGKLAKENNIKFHTDVVQTFAKEPLNVDDLGADFLTFSGHKFNALKGTGGIYIRKNNHVCPLIHGGHQEGMLRAGTENTLGIVSMGKALQKHLEDKDFNKRISKLRDDFEDFVLKEIPEVQINGKRDKRLPGTSNISFEFVEGESILLMLDYKGISVSTGSACSSDSLEPSQVLKSMGLDDEKAHASVRFSLGIQNTQQEIDYVKNVIKEVITKLRDISPLYKEKSM